MHGDQLQRRSQTRHAKPHKLLYVKAIKDKALKFAETKALCTVYLLTRTISSLANRTAV